MDEGRYEYVIKTKGREYKFDTAYTDVDVDCKERIVRVWHYNKRVYIPFEAIESITISEEKEEEGD